MVSSWPYPLEQKYEPICPHGQRGASKLEWFVFGQPSQSSQVFVSKAAQVYLARVGLWHNRQTLYKAAKLARDKHSSLFGFFVGDEESFITLPPGAML